LLYFSGINFIYNKINPAKLFLIGGHSVSSKKNRKKLRYKFYKNYSIGKKFLEKQIKYLLRKGYRFLTFEKIDEILSKGQKLPKKSVIMYFDDGFRDIYLNAYPVFKKHNLPFVLFITTDFINKGPLYLNWEEIRKMMDLAEVGSHGVTHRDFRELNDEEVGREILISSKKLQEETGKKPIALSYPYGGYNQKIKELVRKAGYKFAVTAKRGRADLEDRFELKKVLIYPTDNMIIFKLKLGIFYKIKNLLN